MQFGTVFPNPVDSDRATASSIYIYTYPHAIIYSCTHIRSYMHIRMPYYYHDYAYIIMYMHVCCTTIIESFGCKNYSNTRILTISVVDKDPKYD